MSEKIEAVFHPQAWLNGYAYETDAEGEISWDVTEFLAAMTPEQRQAAIREDTKESDELRNAPTAPEWVKNWGGPFWIEVFSFNDQPATATPSTNGA